MKLYKNLENITLDGLASVGQGFFSTPDRFVRSEHRPGAVLHEIVNLRKKMLLICHITALHYIIKNKHFLSLFFILFYSLVLSKRYPS